MLLTTLEKFILTVEFLWATWWAWLVILVGSFAVYRYFITSESRYLLGILAVIMGIWYVIHEWREYLEEHGRSK